MGPRNRSLTITALMGAVLTIAAACSSAATPTAAVQGATATQAVATSAAPASAPAAAAITFGVTSDASLGDYLTGANGMTLYVFTADTPNTSNCSGKCATLWPPLTAAAGATITAPMGALGTFSLIPRADGSMQVAYNGMPLYYYASDSKGGDTTGQGLFGKWYVAPLSGVAPTSGPAGALGTVPPSAAPSAAPAASAASANPY
jgi:predicted lipoprotein with Yx(FWY)xxD motif